MSRLVHSLNDIGEPAHRWLRTQYPVGCPTHAEIPYGFKAHLLADARAAGYEQALWLDAKVYLSRPLGPAWEAIDRDGCLFMRDVWNTGQWCVDSALEPLGITREESWAIPHIWAGIIGLDFRNERANAFLDEWLRLSRDGVTFHGPWLLGPDAPKAYDLHMTYGHRHDQTAASVLIWRLDMPMQMMGPPWLVVEPPTRDSGSIFCAHGGSRPLVFDDGTRLA